MYFDKTRLNIDKAVSLLRRQLPKGDNDMKNIKYFDGKRNIDIAVNEETAQAYQEIKRSEWRQEKSKQRYEEFSLEALSEAGMQFIDEESNIEEQLILKEEQGNENLLLYSLKKALITLNSEQQKIIQMKFYEGKNDTDISRIMGISRQAVQCRIKIIFEKLKKFL